MKKYGALLALGLAVIFGLAAVLLMNQFLSTQPEKTALIVREPDPTVQIVVPSRDLEIGMPLNEKTLALVDWPKKNVPEGSFTEISELENRVAVTKLFAGLPIIKAELAGPGSGAGLVALIEKGKRAMAIRVDEVTGVGGFILPNTVVDIIGVEQASKKAKARTILSKIKVLARSQETYPNEEGKPKIVRTVTLELKPDQAERLALQTHKGSIHLVLRNPLEEDPPPKKVVKKVRRKAVPTLKSRIKKTQPTPFHVEVLRGSERDTVRFKNIDSQ